MWSVVNEEYAENKRATNSDMKDRGSDPPDPGPENRNADCEAAITLSLRSATPKQPPKQLPPAAAPRVAPGRADSGQSRQKQHAVAAYVKTVVSPATPEPIV
jgi:hypothetical protein